MKLQFIITIIASCFVMGCNNNVGTDDSTTRNLQNLANNFINQYNTESGLSAISITTQCKSMNYGQPITIFAGNVGDNDLKKPDINNLWQIGSNTKYLRVCHNCI
jgi:hypothetical protein